MYEKFLKLKKEKAWLFWLLIVPFLVVAAFELYSNYLVNSGKKVVKDAEKKDNELKAEQDKTEAGAKYHEEKANEIEEDINNKKVDEDWHLK